MPPPVVVFFCFFLSFFFILFFIAVQFRYSCVEWDNYFTSLTLTLSISYFSDHCQTVIVNGQFPLFISIFSFDLQLLPTFESHLLYWILFVCCCLYLWRRCRCGSLGVGVFFGGRRLFACCVVWCFCHALIHLQVLR